MSHRPLSECPLCRYSLKGLPPRHQCPECGFAYDDRMSIRSRDFKRYLVAHGILIVIYLVFIGFIAYKSGIASVGVTTFGILAYLIISSLYVYRNHRRNKIITWPDGFQIIRDGIASPVVPWGEIKAFRKSVVNGWVYVSLHDGTEESVFDSGFFGTHKKAARFVKEVNELRDEYARSGQ